MSWEACHGKHVMGMGVPLGVFLQDSDGFFCSKKHGFLEDHPSGCK